MGVGHPLLCFSAARASTRRAAPSGSVPRRWCDGRWRSDSVGGEVDARRT
jgi:hypothetical protein